MLNFGTGKCGGKRVEQWCIDDDALSHEAYLAWWRKNGGEDEGYTLAYHIEVRLKLLERVETSRGVSPVAVFDLLLARFGPLLAAEGFRRWLAAHADPRSAAGGRADAT